jgi:hypothetical protein
MKFHILLICVAVALAAGSDNSSVPGGEAITDGSKFRYGNGPGVELSETGGQFKLYDGQRYCQVHVQQLEELSQEGATVRTMQLGGQMRHQWMKKAQQGELLGSVEQVAGQMMYYEVQQLITPSGGPPQLTGGYLRLEAYYFPATSNVIMPDNRTQQVTAGQLKFNIVLENFPWLAAENRLRITLGMMCQRIRSRTMDRSYETTDTYQKQQQSSNDAEFGFQEAGCLKLQQAKLTVDGLNQQLDMQTVQQQRAQSMLMIQWELPHFEEQLVQDPELVLLDSADQYAWAPYVIGVAACCCCLAGVAGIFFLCKKKKISQESSNV